MLFLCCAYLQASLQLSEQRVEGYWVSGFLDDVARKHNVNQRKELAKITALPEALLYPRLAKELHVLKARKEEFEFLSPRFEADPSKDGKQQSQHPHHNSRSTKKDRKRARKGT